MNVEDDVFGEDFACDEGEQFAFAQRALAAASDRARNTDDSDKAEQEG
jgi:hypothetical protein